MIKPDMQKLKAAVFLFLLHTPWVVSCTWMEGREMYHNEIALPGGYAHIYTNEPNRSALSLLWGGNQGLSLQPGGILVNIFVFYWVVTGADYLLSNLVSYISWRRARKSHPEIPFRLERLRLYERRPHGRVLLTASLLFLALTPWVVSCAPMPGGYGAEVPFLHQIGILFPWITVYSGEAGRSALDLLFRGNLGVDFNLWNAFWGIVLLYTLVWGLGRFRAWRVRKKEIKLGYLYEKDGEWIRRPEEE